MVDLPNVKCVEPNDLYLNIRLGNLARVKELLDKGEEVDQKNYYWFTPLLHAVSYNQKAICEELLSRGANINAQDKRGFTPLHQAAWKDFEELYMFLLKKGANPNLVSLADEKPYHVAFTKDKKLKYARLTGVNFETRWGETISEAMDIFEKREAARKQKEEAMQ